ncbi:MAG: hypothetical protein KGZ41_00235, partial [Dethiobacter sp.]|nr:hypothetical protein [Dethiobacter sp.]
MRLRPPIAFEFGIQQSRFGAVTRLQRQFADFRAGVRAQGLLALVQVAIDHAYHQGGRGQLHQRCRHHLGAAGVVHNQVQLSKLGKWFCHRLAHPLLGFPTPPSPPALRQHQVVAVDHFGFG